MAFNYLSRIRTSVVSLDEYGAKGDGVTDDTAAFNAAKAVVDATGRVLLISKGTYLVDGEVYEIRGDSYWYQTGFTGVDVMGQAETGTILITAKTPDTTPEDGKSAFTPLGITVDVRGAHHGNGARFNLGNSSTNPDGNTALYTAAVSDTDAGWSAALHGETKHGGGTTLALNLECASYASTGTFYGANISNTSDTAAATNPLTSGPLTEVADSRAINIQGQTNAKGKWKYGLYFQNDSIKTAAMQSGSAAIRIDSPADFGIVINSSAVAASADMFCDADSTNGIVMAGSYTENAIRINDGESLSLNTVGNHKILSGTGSPEGVVTAVPGSLYCRIDGGAGTCFYVKESGSGNTGWVAK